MLGARLAQLSVNRVALHHGPAALVGNGEIRPSDGLALAPAFGDASDRFVCARAPLGDEVLDHRDGNHKDEGEGGDNKALR